MSRRTYLASVGLALGLLILSTAPAPAQTSETGGAPSGPSQAQVEAESGVRAA
jgi:hypothetical protein